MKNKDLKKEIQEDIEITKRHVSQELLVLCFKLRAMSQNIEDDCFHAPDMGKLVKQMGELSIKYASIFVLERVKGVIDLCVDKGE